MATTLAIRRRINSVRNTRQITNAMELVAASKMRRAQAAAQSSRPYREAAHSLLTRLGDVTDIAHHPLYIEREIRKQLYIVITSSQGLAGAYDANIFKLFTWLAEADRVKHIQIEVIAIGKRGAHFIRRLEGVDLIAAYTDINEQPTANDIRPILNTIVEKFTTRQIDGVQVLYTLFKSNLSQEATELTLLPAHLADADVTNENRLTNVTFEPSVEAVLDNTTLRLLEIQLWQALLEGHASEQSMRMLAMKNATDNASDLIDDLTLAFNTARQASITQEIAEITGGAEAIQA